MNKIFIVLLFLLIGCRKDYTSIGDSITYMNGYQKYVCDSTDYTFNNLGFNGKALAGNDSIYEKVSSFNFSSIDLLTIFVGTNDFRKNIPITLFGSTLNSLILKIKTQNPHCEIYLITPIIRNNSGYDTFCKNDAGFLLIDYRNEIIRISEKHKIPVIDLYYKSGINSRNLNYYTLDGLHPNSKGFELIGKYIASQIK